MSTAAAVLPATLRDKLAAAARRVRLLRAVRGISLVVLVLVLGAAAALAADAWLGLPGLVRTGLLITWVVLGVLAALVGLVLPLARRLDADALAALVEEKYPDLGERLTSSVELAGVQDLWAGSPALIALLFEETEARTHPLDFLRAVPARHTTQVAAAAVSALALPVVAALLMPDRLAELGGRFLIPWREAPVQVPYALHVTPGDAVAARGRPLTLAARVEVLDEAVATPRSGCVVLMNGDGTTTRLPMRMDGEAFAMQIDPVAGDFDYRVEAGSAVSPSFHITAVEPITVAAGSPTVTVMPPTYALGTVRRDTLTGFPDLAPLQHSRVRFDVRFTQPAERATLVWPGDKGQPVRQDLALAEDRSAGSVELPAIAGGAYKLVLVGSNGFTTELAGRELAVRIDQPPAVVHFAGSSPKALPTALPYDSIPLELALADDIGVASAQVEYRVNGGPAQREDIPLQGGGTRQAAARHSFRLAGKVKDGDQIEYRLRVADNRDVPEAGLTPQVVYHPAERWLGLKIDRRAEPQAQKDIIAQRDEINKRLDAIRRDLEREQRGLYKVRQESRQQPALLPEQALELKELRRENDAAQQALRDLAREAGEARDLQPLADRLQQVADQDVQRAEREMAQAEKEEQAQQRNDRLKAADRELSAALEKLDALRKANDQLAQERLDRARLELAAQREEDLAKQAAEMAAKDPVKDPEAKPKAERLRQEQDDVAKDLQRLADQSDPLRQAMEAAKAEEAKKLAERARELARAERELADARRDVERGRLGDLADKQKALAEKIARLAEESKLPAKAAPAAPVKPEQAQKAAEALERGDAGEALRQQEQVANDLQRLGAELDRAVDLARDPREAARQLARLQKGLQQRLDEETRKKDAAPPLAERLKPLEREQKAVAEAAKQLAVPPRDQAAQKDQAEAGDRAARAGEALHQRDPRDAAAQMDVARQALERLADKLPALAQRRQQARAEVEQLRRQQDEVARQAQEAARQAEKPDAKAKDDAAKKFAEAARQQADAAQRLAKADIPEYEAQKQRAQEALDKALADLLDGKPQDAAESQKEAKRELDRLHDALSGKPEAQKPPAAPEPKPADQPPQQQAREAAKQQRDLAKQVQQAQQEADRQPGPEGKQAQQRALEQLGQQQQKLNEQVSRLPADKMQKSLEQARQKMNDARQALAKNDPGQAQQQQKEAADALDRLAEKLPARAPDAARQEPADPPQGLPRHDQAEQARQLAKEQRDLRDALQRRAAEPPLAPGQTPEGVLSPLVRQQEEVAKYAEDLGRDYPQQAGHAKQAAEAARQAAKQIQAGELREARGAGGQAGQQLQELAKDLLPAQGGGAARKAQNLAGRQADINRRLELLARSPDIQRAQQQGRQQELEQEAGKLAKELQQLGQQMGRSPQAAQAMQQAGQAGQQAQAAMQQAGQQERQGNQGQMQQAQQQAAQALDRAAELAAQAGQKMMGPQQSPPLPQQAAQAVQQAQGQIGQAQQQLAQGKMQGAQAAMAKAAQALQQAAQQMGQQPQQQPGRPTADIRDSQRGAAPAGMPEDKALPPDLKKHAGKRWGELPGELRTKIVQDLKAKYGDDYAQIIKQYFEQIADVKK